MKRSLFGVAIVASACLATSGCIIVADDDDWDDGYYVEDGTTDDPGLDAEAVVATIDVGATIGVVDPGQGAGIFVEAVAEGQWRVFTTCDTDVNGYACAWDIYLRGDGVDLTDTEGLEGDDELVAGTGAIDGYFLTDSDVDGILFAATPGATVELTTLLDGAAAPTYIYWVGDGVQNEGAPTDPIVFQPR